jgi:hypothetical protein
MVIVIVKHVSLICHMVKKIIFLIFLLVMAILTTKINF